MDARSLYSEMTYVCSCVVYVCVCVCLGVIIDQSPGEAVAVIDV